MQGDQILFFNLPTPLQPYQSISLFLAHRSSSIHSPTDPLFVDDNNNPISRYWFQKHLKSVLVRSGIPAKPLYQPFFRHMRRNFNFKKQSPRTPNSNSRPLVFECIRTDLSHIRQAHQLLIKKSLCTCLILINNSTQSSATALISATSLTTAVGSYQQLITNQFQSKLRFSLPQQRFGHLSHDS